jgi:hypothetical protein
MRLVVAEGLLRSTDTAKQSLGVAALEAMLKTSHFSSSYNFEFGMRSRDYGYYPRTSKDVAAWFSAVLDFAEPYALLGGPVGGGVRRAIGREFRGLWTNVSRADQLERIAHAVAAQGWGRRQAHSHLRRKRIAAGRPYETQVTRRIFAPNEFARQS